uniref:Uncharacterized protein n=1 Tax=Heterorhabditis bacteriophora TaxID=37862 RepID=A0A1I7WEB0_HETBA
MDQKSKNDPALAARNLVSIQRIDPCAVAILDKACFFLLLVNVCQTKYYYVIHIKRSLM